MSVQDNSVIGVAIIGADILPCHVFEAYYAAPGSVQARIGIECDAEQFARIAQVKAFDKIVIEYHGTKQSKQTHFERWTLRNVRDVEGTYSPPLAAMYVSADQCTGEKVDEAQG